MSRNLLPMVLLFAAVAHGFVSLHPSFRVASPHSGSGCILMRGPSPPKKRKLEPRSPRIERHASPNESDEQQRARHLHLVQAAARHHAAAVADGLAQRGFALVDNFLPAETVSILRSECVSLLHGNKLYASESTRWDEESAQVVTYKKVNVMSYNLVGGTEYELAPRLTEYCVALVSSLPALINERFPEAALSARVHTNKLAVCLGEGSHYQKHYDNSGRDDRKLTVIVYLQTPQYSLEDGGCFRMFVDGDGGPPAGAPDGTVSAGADADGHRFVDIAPVGGRLLAFWSDSMVHAVCPSFATSGDEATHRWALTVWMHTEDIASIRYDPDAEARHFPGLQAGAAKALAG
jgi:hypothetical protein